MSHSFLSTEEEVSQFLQELGDILLDKKFNIFTDLDILIKQDPTSRQDPYSTMNTMLELDYDLHDLHRQLIS